MKLLLPLLLTATLARAQAVVQIVDSATGKPLPYASVVNPATNAGWYTTVDGMLSLPATTGGTTMVASFVGYTAKTFVATSNTRVLLAPKPLPPVVVYSCPQPRTATINMGKKRSNISVGYGLSGLNWTTRVVNSWRQPVRLQELRFTVLKRYGGENPNTPIRLRLFGVDSTGAPAEELTTSDLTVVPEKFGEIRVPLADARIVMPPAGIMIVFEMFDAGSEFLFTHTWRDVRTKTEHTYRLYGYFLEAFTGADQGWRLQPGIGWRKPSKPSHVAPSVVLEVLRCR